ncbi:MAG: murein biosynthesis integral membrane protein MurJ [Bdellovibrionaceae bacterium]|nr:murein biosynthesis integral membrane protein MurJ [Pseudobdellovibrionaceae bacterium]
MKKDFLQKEKNYTALVGLQAGLMSLGTFFSRILGFLRDLFIANFFSKTETDIFFVAFRFPNFFRRVLGEGAFSASVTPALTEHLEKKGKKETQGLHSQLFSFLFCVTVLLTFFGVVFMEPIMNFLFGDSAYASVEGKLEKTIVVAKLVFTYLFFVSLYSYFMSVAQVFGRFFLPALAPAFFNISLIVFAWLPQNWWPFPSLSLAWAVIIGGILQLCPVLFELFRLNLLPRFYFRKNKELLKIGKRFLPGMLGLAGLSLIGLINVYYAGQLEEGANSYIYYGDRLMEFPKALIAVSIGTALIPELTRRYTVKGLLELKDTISYYLNFLLFLILPCALLFFIQAETIVQILFGRGEFDETSVFQTAEVLRIYSIVLIFSSVSRILSSCFFAINKNWFMVMGTVLFVTFHFILAYFLTPAYGLQGLVSSTALSSIFYFIILIYFLLRLIGGLHFKPVIVLLLNIAPGLVVLFLCLIFIPFLFNRFYCILFNLFLSESCPSQSILFDSFFSSSNIFSFSYIQSHSLISFLVFVFACSLGGFLYLRLGHFFREPMAEECLKIFRKAFKK